MISTPIGLKHGSNIVTKKNRSMASIKGRHFGNCPPWAACTALTDFYYHLCHACALALLSTSLEVRLGTSPERAPGGDTKIGRRYVVPSNCLILGTKETGLHRHLPLFSSLLFSLYIFLRRRTTSINSMCLVACSRPRRPRLPGQGSDSSLGPVIFVRTDAKHWSMYGADLLAAASVAFLACQ